MTVERLSSNVCYRLPTQKRHFSWIFQPVLTTKESIPATSFGNTMLCISGSATHFYVGKNRMFCLLNPKIIPYLNLFYFILKIYQSKSQNC